MSNQRFSELVSDYLNDRLSSEDRQHFEKALAIDPELQDTVALERQIQQVIQKAPSEPLPQADFSRFKARLETPQPAKQQPWLAPVAACFLIAAVGIVSLSQQPTTQDYTTLSSPERTYTDDKIRLVANDAESLEQLIQQHSLTVVYRYPGIYAVDVTSHTKLDMLLSTLQQDPRTLLVEKVDAP